jgi:iron complex transport system substrate-binding protein
MTMSSPFPQRIVCMTEETTETLYLLGEEWRIVGISGFTVRPSRARTEKPKVSAFTSAKIDKIIKLEPDLVLGFSDIQADIAAELVRRGVSIHIFNHRSVAEILGMVQILGGMVGCPDKASDLRTELQQNLDRIVVASARIPARPRVYFEEWDDPQISGIRWVSELTGVAGGDDCFPELAGEALGKQRIIADPEEVIRRQPDIIVGSWCGKKFRPEKVAARPGWDAIPAVRNGDLFEIKSALILQPGPAALTDGLDALHGIISAWAISHSSADPAPDDTSRPSSG